jgi:hypothetical protein
MIDKPIVLMFFRRRLPPIAGAIARSWQCLGFDKDSMDMLPNWTNMAEDGANGIRRSGTILGSGQFD